MSMGVVRGIFNNGIANITQKVVRILDQLLLVPFFLTAWGAEYYGEWLTLSIVPSILAFSDLGFGSAACNGFVLAYAAGDKQQAANFYKSGFWIISGSVLLGIVISFSIVIVGNYAGWFAKAAIIASDAIWAVTLMMASKLISFYTQLAEGFFRGAQRAATGSFLSSGNCLLNIIVAFVVLYMGCGVVGFAFSHFVISVFYTIFYWFLGRRMITFDGLKGKFVRKDIHMIMSKGIAYLATPVWQSIYFQGTTLVVRIVLGAEAVAVFNTVRTVCRSVNQMFGIINAAIFPELQFEYGRGNLLLVQRLFRIAVCLSIFIGFIGAIVLCMIGLPLYYWWIQNALMVEPMVWNIFMIGVFMNAVWWTSVVTYRMTNQPKYFAIASTLISCLSVGICYVMSEKLGLAGAALATTIFETVMVVCILPDACRQLGLKVSDLLGTYRDLVTKGTK